ncbi:PLD nuclease N-terminal domain-containing protein [Acaricomes phytoseiuli]|uniref:PLD nuclease N-terminal domain-containing protein n=1 Tax=Acaricomes phytoseiuli TaxID=291968 RepID=UPI0014613438|nr:PLD nuclease N-terminal domain-containing protein [Acaricomes phytoseiuli]
MMILPILMIVLLAVALISLARSKSVTPGQRVLWAVVIVLLPILGSVLWLVVAFLIRRQEDGKQSSANRDEVVAASSSQT